MPKLPTKDSNDRIDSFNDLIEMAANAKERGRLLEKFAQQWRTAEFTPEMKSDFARTAKKYVLEHPDLVDDADDEHAHGKKRKNLPFNSGAYAFQALLYVIESENGNRVDTFPAFSTFRSAKTGQSHPDGKFGPLTKAVFLGKEYDKKRHVYVDAPPNAFNLLADGPVVPAGKSAAQLAAEAAARLAAEEAATRARLENASPEDAKAFTFKRAQMQYLEAVKSGLPSNGFHAAVNPHSAANNFTTAQLKGISDAVNEFSFQNGKLVDRDYKNPATIAQLRAAVLEKTRDLGVSEAQISQLNFSTDKTRTRSLAGNFGLAEKAVIAADGSLQQQAAALKAHFEQNAAFLEKAGTRAQFVSNLADLPEEKRGLYFKTAYVPTLNMLASKERIDISAEYQAKIENQRYQGPAVIAKLEQEREAKIANAPSNQLLKQATDSLKDYKDAMGIYAKASDYETQRKIFELSDGKLDHKEKVALRKLGDSVEDELRLHKEMAKSRVSILEGNVKTETDPLKKAALQTNLANAQDTLASLTDLPKNFDQRDKVAMVRVDLGNDPLIHVDGASRKEQRLQRRTDREEAKLAAKEPATLATAPNDASKLATVAATPEAKTIAANLQAYPQNPDGTVKPAVIEASKGWENAAAAVKEDLKKLGTPITQTEAAPAAATPTDLASVAQIAKNNNIVLNDKLELDKTQNLQNLKPKETALTK